MSQKALHVVPAESGWWVRKSGAARATSLHDTQQEAIVAAVAIAKRQGVELYIHGSDGRIRERNSYCKDPHPPKG